MDLKYSVGLDVSSKKINGCISLIDNNQKVTVKSSIVFNNDLKGFKSFEDWMIKHRRELEIPLVICMEATGIYHENCALYLFERNYRVSIILPNKAKKYLEAIGLKSKNDSIDAKGLSQMGAEQCLEQWEPFGKYFYELRLYTRQNQNLQELKTVISSQLHALKQAMYTNQIVIEQLESTIVLFDLQLKELEKKIKLHLESDAEIKQKVANIIKIKGLGILTIATILAETNGFDLFKNYKQLVSYAGFDVVESQSGARIGKTKISKKGNSRIRRALHMPSLVVITYKEKPFLDLFERTYEKHGVKMKSYVAVQKKLLSMIYYLWKKNEMYNPDYQNNIQEKELEFSSLLAFEKGTKNSLKQVEAIQGKHPVKNRSMFPLC